MNQRTILILPASTILILLTSGCSSDENLHVAEIAQEFSRRHTVQTQKLLEAQKELAIGSRKLVEADSQARREMAQMHRQFQEERLNLAESYDQLELERRQIAKERNRAPIVAAAITNFGLLLACVLPLVVSVFLLLRKPLTTDSQVLEEFLLQEVLNETSAKQKPPISKPSSSDDSVNSKRS